MATQSVDLAKVFQAVTKELKANKTALNEADTFNHDHGSNMVDVFQTVSRAVKEKKEAPASEQLEHASRLLQNKPSGSAKVYSQNLADAATRFQGKQLTADNAMQLVVALMGSGQTTQTPAAEQDPLGGLAGSLLSGVIGGQQQSKPSGGGQDPLGGLAGSLLSGMMGGGQQAQPSAASQDALGGLAGSLISGMMGGAQSETQTPKDQSQAGFDMNDLMQAGMAFMQSQQQGSSPMESIISALMSGSSVGSSTHRKESGAMIINTILKVVGAMAKK